MIRPTHLWNPSEEIPSGVGKNYKRRAAMLEEVKSKDTQTPDIGKGQPPQPEKNHEFESIAMNIAFEHAESDHYFRIGLCISLYFVLLLIWLPGINFDNKIVRVDLSDSKPVKRKVLKPPPQQPLERVITAEKHARRIPMPDVTPNDPEPMVEPDPPPVVEVMGPTDWEIGIPDAVPEPPEVQVARVGQVGVEPPVIVKRIQPEYPAMGYKIRMQGFVILEAVLRKDGKIDNIKVLRGLGKGKFGFEEEAVKALKKWQFLPGKVNDKPSDVMMTLKVDFAIKTKDAS